VGAKCRSALSVDTVTGFGTPERTDDGDVADRNKVSHRRAQVGPVARFESPRKLIRSQGTSLRQFAQNPLF